MARPKKPTDELKDQRIPIMMAESELKDIDDWSFENRIRSRGEAIRRLCSIGIAFSAMGPKLFDLMVKSAGRLADSIDAFEDAETSNTEIDARAFFVKAVQEHMRLLADGLVGIAPAYTQTLVLRKSGDIRAQLETIKEIERRFERVRSDDAAALNELMSLIAEITGIKLAAEDRSIDDPE